MAKEKRTGEREQQQEGEGATVAGGKAMAVMLGEQKHKLGGRGGFQAALRRRLGAEKGVRGPAADGSPSLPLSWGLGQR